MGEKNRRKGFTLVELIVVLVILAILAALLVPALTGYIDRAKAKTAIAQCRSCVMAAQTILAEKSRNKDDPTLTIAEDGDEILTLAELGGTSGERFPLEFVVERGRLMHLYYFSAPYYVTFCRDFDECNDHDGTFTTSTDAPTGSEAYSLKKTLGNLFDKIQTGLLLNDQHQLNSSYKNNSSSSTKQFWDSLSPALQTYLGNKVWQGYGLQSSDSFTPPIGTTVTNNRNLFTVTLANESTLTGNTGNTAVYVYCVDDTGTLWRQQISLSYSKDDQNKTGGAMRLGKVNTGSLQAGAWVKVT